MKTAEFVIIGSGQGGVPLAINLAEKGNEVILFERSDWGGTCVNTGCIPSKTLLASAHTTAHARHAQTLGIHADVSVDFQSVMSRVRDSIQPDKIAEQLKHSNVQIVAAEAKFVAPHTVKGGDISVEAETIVINTGKSPFIPDIPGLADTPYLTYQSFWQIESLPETMLILGGGYTGLELAQALQRLGSQVHLIEIGERLVADEEEEVSQALQQALETDGVHIHLNTTVQEVDYTNEHFELTLDATTAPLTGDSLLIATGRQPNVDALNVTHWGIAQDENGHIQVDNQFRTTVDDVYALGDVTGQPAFTHVSWEDHRRLLAILDGASRTRGDRVLGYAFFTDPQVGRVGLTAPQAVNQGFDVRMATLPLSNVARATMTNHTHGFYRLVVDEQTDRILGATFVGPQAAELIHIILAHMEAESTWQVLERAQHIHPTYAEALPTLARKFKQ